MFAKIVEKLNKSELWVTIAAPIAGFLATKLGLPEEQLTTFLLGLFGLAGSYVAGRSAVKHQEARGLKAEMPSAPVIDG